MHPSKSLEIEITGPTKPGPLHGQLSWPAHPTALILQPALSGTSRFRYESFALRRSLAAHGLAAATVDLLTFDEEQLDHVTHHLRGNAALQAGRAVDAIRRLAPIARDGGLPLLVLARQDLHPDAVTSAVGFRPTGVAGLVVETDGRALTGRGGPPQLFLPPTGADELAAALGDWVKARWGHGRAASGR